MAKCTSDSIWLKYRSMQTSTGFSFSNLIQPGVLHATQSIGIALGNEHTASDFRDLVYPVVKNWHKFDPHTRMHTRGDLAPSRISFTNAQRLRLNKYVITCRMCASRNVSGYAFPTAASAAELSAISDLFLSAAELCAVSERSDIIRPGNDCKIHSHTRSVLRAEGIHLLLPSQMHFQSLSGATRHWPTGRAVIYEPDTFILSVNQEDHFRLVSTVLGADIVACFRRYCTLLEHFRAAARADGRDWAYCERLGYLTTNIADLGFRAVIRVQVPLLSDRGYVQLEELAAQHDLQATYRQDSEWELSNRTRIGLTEVEIIQSLIDGVAKIISVEERLEEVRACESKRLL